MRTEIERIAIVSDEVSPNFVQALDVCLPLGIRAYEIRGLTGGRVPYCDADALDEVQRLAHQHQLTILGVSPGFFKAAWDHPKAMNELEEGFDRTFALLDQLGTRRVTVFSFLRSTPEESMPAGVFDLMGRAADKCRRAGVELLIENGAFCWGNTGSHLAEIARAVGVRVTWDPGNSEASGQAAYPQGYEAVRDLIAHVHLKNWLPGFGNTAILDGQADLAGQVAALRRDNYPGYYCIEPHQWANGAEAARINTAQLLALLDAAMAMLI